MNNKKLTVETLINAEIEKVWEYWTSPNHITKWCFASDDWHAPKAENDVRVGGSFTTEMASKDGKNSFYFTGVYTQVKQNELIEYEMSDKRHVKVEFTPLDNQVKVTETFEMEQENSEELQRNGWQAILDNFKKYTENF